MRRLLPIVCIPLYAGCVSVSGYAGGLKLGGAVASRPAQPAASQPSAPSGNYWWLREAFDNFLDEVIHGMATDLEKTDRPPRVP